MTAFLYQRSLIMQGSPNLSAPGYCKWPPLGSGFPPGSPIADPAACAKRAAQMENETRILQWWTMKSRARQINLVPAPDGRQSETALAIARGTARLLRSLGFSCISELPLPSGRRADLVALNERGEIWIVEIKSSAEDLRADQKWQDYRAHCDRLFFAFTQDLPCEIFPGETGLIVADAYGAHMHCEAPGASPAGADPQADDRPFRHGRGQRINRLVDPQGHGEVLG